MARTALVRHGRQVDIPYRPEMDARFSYEHGGMAVCSTARVYELNAQFLEFESENPPPRGAKVEMYIDWPFLLQNVCPLELVVQGTVARRDSMGAEVRIDDYEFRTCGRFSFGQAPVAQSACSIVA